MKIIQEVTELIHEEIEDVKKYAELAAKVKAEHPSLAQVFYTLSAQEDSHQAALHAEVVKIIEQYRRTNGQPPANMLAVYEYLHNRQIEKALEVKTLQNMYKES